VIVWYADNTIANNLAIDDAEAVRKNAYQLALGSDDPVFHSELYDWLVKQGRTDDLLEVGAYVPCPIYSY
jgi:nuclear pore complex protein Nup155